MTNHTPDIPPEVRAELARQEPLIRELTAAIAELVTDAEPPIIASALLDMLCTLGASDERGREVLPKRLRKLAAMLEMMPPGIPTQAELAAFLTKANAMLGNVAPPTDAGLILPDHIQRH